MCVDVCEGVSEGVREPYTSLHVPNTSHTHTPVTESKQQINEYFNI